MAKTKSIEAAFEADELLALAKLDIEKGNVEPALLKLKQLLVLDAAPLDAMAVTARLYAQLGLFERAQTLFKQYLEKQPQADIEWFQLGMAYFDAGDRQQALQTWNQLLEKQATHPPALFYKALCLAKENKLADARQTLDRLLQSVSTDNMYFAKGKELLDKLNHEADAKAPAKPSSQPGRTLPKDAYQTEH